MASAAATTQSENAFSAALSVTDCARTGHQLSQQNPATTQPFETLVHLSGKDLDLSNMGN